MNFIRKIADGKPDHWVKKQFLRYGRGTYESRALLEVTKGTMYTIRTGFEFAGELAYALAETIVGKTRVTGGIITASNIEKDLPVPLAGKKQFAGVKTFLLETDMTKHQVQELFTLFPFTLIFLSFTTDNGEIKTKVKNPKSAKSGQGEEKALKADFCTFKTKDTTLVRDLLFDIDTKAFKKVTIAHTFAITDLMIPKEYEKDFVVARLHALRKGRLIREIYVDGTRVVKEYTLEV